MSDPVEICTADEVCVCTECTVTVTHLEPDLGARPSRRTPGRRRQGFSGPAATEDAAAMRDVFAEVLATRTETTQEAPDE